MVAMRVVFIAIALVSMLIAPAHAKPPEVTSVNGSWQVDGGRAIFFYVRDTTPGISTCDAVCLNVWSPLVAADDGVAGDGWTIEVQPDGRRLWAFEGKPVYRLKDIVRHSKGGSSALWVQARSRPWLPPGVTLTPDRHFVSTDGRALRTPARSACDETCSERWEPLLAPEGAVAGADWSIIDAPGGGRMWAYADVKWPIYIARNIPLPAPEPGSSAARRPAVTMYMPRQIDVLPDATPIALRAGAYDMYDDAVTKAPQRLPVAPPVYPPASLRAGETGLVVLQYCIDARGAPTAYTLAIPSAFEALNAATLQWAAAIRFTPGEVNGKRAEICGYQVVFEWTIRN